MLNRVISGVLTLRGHTIKTLQHQTYRYSTAVEKWEIYASVCLERLPVVTPPLDAMQTKYKNFLNESELTSSFKSDHEVRRENDLIVMEKIKNEDSDLDPETINKITAQDFEDASNDEFASFKFATIETDADKKNDQKSLERKLQSHLVLLIEQEIGSEKKFVLPLGKHKEGESLRQTAERIFKETCGDDMDIRIFGNAPCGYYRYKWSNNKENVGAKIFFYYANPVKGELSKSTKYKWLTRNELESTLPKKYFSSINDFLVDEK